MFETGRRSIFDVCRPHCGHSIEMQEIQEEGVVKGIKVYCRTCSTSLLSQESQDYAITEEINRRKASRLSAMSFDQWQNQFYRELIVNHDQVCDCQEWDGCPEMQNYEGTELTQFYEEYLQGLTPAPAPSGWEAPEPTPFNTWTT